MSSTPYQYLSVTKPAAEEQQRTNKKGNSPVWVRALGALLFVAAVAASAGAVYMRIKTAAGSAAVDSEEITLPQLTAQNMILYGDYVSLQNGWNSWKGGFLDTKGKPPLCVAEKFCVQTGATTNRDLNSGIWIIESASGKSGGSPVMNGDRVYFRNQYNGFGGYLDVNGRGCNTGSQDHFCVSTSNLKNRHNYSGTWKITATQGWVKEITSFTSLHLESQYTGYQGITGGFLDVNGNGCLGQLHCVGTSKGPTRHLGSTFWRMFKNPLA